MTLQAEALLREASAASGLEDFGPDTFREPLRRLVHALNTEARLSADGLRAQHARLVGLLVNRLRVEEVYRLHPEIDSEEIAVAVCIVGLPRTGTTMLHKVLSSDTRFLFPRFHEVRHPVAPDSLRAGAPDDRIAQVEAELKWIVATSPELAAIHPLSSTGAEEEIGLIEHSFYSTSPEAFNYVPEFGRWLGAQDNRPGYSYLLRLLRLLQWQKRRAGEQVGPWLLKSPHHLHYLDLLLECFRDARIVLTHRDPVQTLPSYASMIVALNHLGCETVDPVAVGAYVLERFAASLERATAIRDQFPERFMDVAYRDCVNQPLEVLRRLYAAIGMPFTAAVEVAMESWLEENRRDKRAAHHYAAADYGYTDAGLAQSFAAYRQRFLQN
ncbi:MAG: sulfotransferase [Gammaproteobacteria bacterium]|nr:sulfotransferase [Gammaproteobacteria bacterium]MBP6053563.1 sulfotransferase [Pseudomonadales bacterium]